MRTNALPVMLNRLTGKPARHPIHGHVLTAIGQLPNGRWVYPAIGGAPDDGDGDDGDGGDDDGDGDDGAPENVKDSKGKDLGYPARTKVKDMTVEQQAAYWKHNARSKEDQLAKLGDVTSLKKKAEAWEQHQKDNASELDKAREAAKEEGRKEATTEANTRAVKAILKVGLGARDMDDDDIDDLVSVVNPTAFIGDDGDVDTERIKNYLDRVGGPAKGDDDEDEGRKKKWPDTGGGRRRGKSSSGSGSSVAAVMEARRAARESKQTTN